MEAARKRPELTGLSTTFLPSVPQMYVKVDRDKVLKQGVPLNDVYRTLQTYMGGLFVNYFNRFGRQWQVYVEAEGKYRTRAEDLGQFYVRNSDGAPVPLSALTRIEERARTRVHHALQPLPQRADQRRRRARLQHRAGDESARRGLHADHAARDGLRLPAACRSRRRRRGKACRRPRFSALSLMFVFLILAALYESWSLPFSVLLCTPIAVFGAYVALFARQMENNVYAQIGLIMLIGLGAKNAILIVEFAKTRCQQGKPVVEAALEGAHLRLRPILMTSFAFIFGCLPLWLAQGSGAVARRVMGTCVIGGMLAASLLAIFLIPVTFYVVEKLRGAKYEAEKRDAEK